eukprot:Tamp_26686.p2 GENE.Tamp_26686~~Tamp_26686.p2  ORF type:complete len:167 (-),score=47.60 Tamp_26686:352-852(-)
MSDDDEFLEDFVEQIKSSRENAMAGKYEDALAFYDGVLAQMQQRMKRDLDGELMHKWMAARESITCEAQHVREIAQVISQFKEALPAVIAGPPGAKGPPVRAGTIGAKHVAASRYACAHPPLVTLLRTRDAFTMMLRRDALPLPWPRSAARARALAAVRGGRTWAA